MCVCGGGGGGMVGGEGREGEGRLIAEDSRRKKIVSPYPPPPLSLPLPSHLPTHPPQKITIEEY